MWSQRPPNGPKRPDIRSIWSTGALVCQLLSPHTCSRCLSRVSRIPVGPQTFQAGGGESPTPHGLYSHCPCARSQGLCRCPGPGQSHRSSPRHFLTARCFEQPGLCGYTRGAKRSSEAIRPLWPHPHLELQDTLRESCSLEDRFLRAPELAMERAGSTVRAAEKSVQ